MESKSDKTNRIDKYKVYGLTHLLHGKLIINYEKQIPLYFTLSTNRYKIVEIIDTEVLVIERVSAFKYLGVYMDELLYWSEHVDYLYSSHVKYFGIFNHMEYKVISKQSMELNYALIYSKHKQTILYVYHSNIWKFVNEILACVEFVKHYFT